jgi:type I restriction enzyme M protein
MDIKSFIEKLGFTGNLFTYSKEYKLHNYTIRIDLQKGKIYYRKDEKTTVERQEDGQIQLGDHTTSNFSAPESLVVLECVNRLLEKGYAPNDIHLERKWKVGHGASGGKADINIYNKSDGKTLLIIECKTWGEEFEKEKNKMEEHGGQLFTYLNQDKNAQFLVLYASKYENDEFIYDNLIVQVKDRKEDLEKSLKQIEEENIKLYRDANNKSELFDVWKESFNKYFHFNGIFDADANAYSLELKALKKKNLKKLDDAKGLFNKFAEILRHNNISDNANAFNRVLSLFLCKIVDEEKKDEDVLDFQVKEDEEYEHIIDRLQALYQKGMAKLKEEIVYYSEEDLHKIIKLYPKQTPIEKVEAIFRELKYYTNNEFAFKEVHNKKLFQQNARVLVEVIKLIQNYQFRFTSKQQVLGDFFELMLNHGVKQSEGQFFTPIPIVRYIILSLGFENIINEKLEKQDTEFLPKILDYACGAGHFLTESIEELQQVLKGINNANFSLELSKKVEEYRMGTEWAADYIFGIEKDYRLARTSQIACYINGDGDANIIFGDGLEEQDRLNLEKKKFDVVIANPPYSVKAFRNYLNVGRTHYDLFESLTDRSKEIEVLFIERTKQVLAENGLAGIVLPSTILTNTGLYSKAREIFLKYFEIKAITELGGSTFLAAKGMTTVVVFLKRRPDDFVKDREYIANDLFNGISRDKKMEHIDSNRLLKIYVDYREFEETEYKNFLKGVISEKLKETEMFKEYYETFENSTDTKNYISKPTFKNLSNSEQKKEIDKRFLEFVKQIEKEKFLYFTLCLCSEQDKIYEFQKTVIVKTGNDINDQKEYLGYTFEGDRGSEGIKVINYGGKLFDENHYDNPEKANSYIRNAIKNIDIKNISRTQEKNVFIYSLADLIVFKQVVFDKILKENPEAKFKIESRFQLVKLDSVSMILKGVTYGNNDPVNYETPNIILTADNISLDGKFQLNKQIFLSESLKIEESKKLARNDIFICFSSGSINHLGKVAFISSDTKYYAGGFMGIIRANEKIISPKYLFSLLNSNVYRNIVREEGTGANIQNLSSKISNLKIPLPTKEIQNKIVIEIESLEKVEINNKTKVEKLNAEIFVELQSSIQGKSKVKLDNICTIQSGGTPKREVAEYWNGTVNWLRSEVCQNCYVYESDGNEKITELGLSKSSAKLLKPDTILMALVGATIGRVAYLTFEATTNQNVAGLYPKDSKQLISKFLFYTLMNDFEKNFGSAKGKFTMANMTTIKNLEIALPSFDEQKKLVAMIDKKEKEIEKLKLALSTVETEKEEVLKKYL